MRRIVIDTDPGIDDAHAILMASAYPDTKIEALTTVAGNVPVERTTANALIILDILRQDIPVHQGCEDALVVPTARRAISHGTDGLGDSGYPLSSRHPSPEGAIQALIRLANEAPGELELVALAPLTNIAMATRLDPGLPHKYRSLTIMGGAIYAKGNAWTPAAEFNFSIDPEAAAIVLDRWPRVTIVPWETAMEYGISEKIWADISRLSTSRAQFFRRIFQNRFDKQIKEFGTCYDADALAMAVALEPDIIREATSRYVQVELESRLTRGQTVVDWFDIESRPANASFVLNLDRDRFLELIKLGLQ